MFLSYQRMPMTLRPGVDRMIVLPLVYATPPPRRMMRVALRARKGDYEIEG